MGPEAVVIFGADLHVEKNLVFVDLSPRDVTDEGLRGGDGLRSTCSRDQVTPCSSGGTAAKSVMRKKRDGRLGLPPG
jgi:hypothetical protein